MLVAFTVGKRNISLHNAVQILTVATKINILLPDLFTFLKNRIIDSILQNCILYT